MPQRARRRRVRDRGGWLLTRLPPFFADLVRVWGIWFAFTLPWLLGLAACVAAWRRGWVRPLVLLVGASLTAPLGVCAWDAAVQAERTIEQVRTARAMGLRLTDPRVDSAFPGEYLMSALVPGRTTRAEARAVVPRARARYGCRDYDVFFFLAEQRRGPLALFYYGDVVVVKYDTADGVTEAYVVDSIAPPVDRCQRF